MSDMGLVVVGAAGRMGQAIIARHFRHRGRHGGRRARPQGRARHWPRCRRTGRGRTYRRCDHRRSAAALRAGRRRDRFLRACRKRRICRLCRAGTHRPCHRHDRMLGEDDAAIAAAARHATIVKSGNMSLGVNLLAALVEQAARALPAADFDIEILEMHHRHKVDAPSGTALLLGEAAAKGREIALPNSPCASRDGHTGAREAGTIGFATLRGGSVVGDHSVLLAGTGERITLSHHAEDRSIFARGAVQAALWAKDRKPGLYSMRDVLGLPADEGSAARCRRFFRCPVVYPLTPSSRPLTSAAHLAQVAELVDAHGSGPCAARRGGSSPLLGTTFLQRWSKPRKSCDRIIRHSGPTGRFKRWRCFLSSHFEIVEVSPRTRRSLRSRAELQPGFVWRAELCCDFWQAIPRTLVA